MLQETLNRARLTWVLMRDPRVALSIKGIPIFAIIYVVSPLDLIPFFPIDDITVVLFAMKIFIDSVPAAIVNEYRRELGIPIEDESDDEAA